MLSNPWVRSIRPHQWSKAALVIAAPFAAFHVSVAIGTQLAVAVALACVAASGTYLLNDAIDAPADRLHPMKRDRPIASGAIGRFEAVFVAVVLLAAAPAVGRFVNGPTGLALVAYVALTIAYSTKLKEIAIVDIATIAAGFVVRVLIGAAATHTPVSRWFLLAVGAAAVMVAAGKRRGEVHELGTGAVAHRKSLGVYHDAMTSRLLVGAASVLFLGLIAWAVIGGGGPQLEEGWAALLLVPAAAGIGRYLTIALRGKASAPELLVRDRGLQVAGLATVVVFVVGNLVS